MRLSDALNDITETIGEILDCEMSYEYSLEAVKDICEAHLSRLDSEESTKWINIIYNEFIRDYKTVYAEGVNFYQKGEN